VHRTDHGLSVQITQIHRLVWVFRLKLVGYVVFLITSKVSDVRRRGATTEAYGPNGEEGSLARLWREGNPPEADNRSRTCPCQSRDDASMVDQG
jgi:hypothetical protein